MPFVRIKRIVIDLERSAKGYSAVGAAHKHYVGRVSPGRNHAGQHVNVVVSGTAGTVNCQEQHPGKSYSIDSTATELATQVDSGASVKSWCLTPDLRIARALAIKRAGSFAADEQVAIRIHIQRSIYRRIGNNDRRLPGDSAVGGTLKLHAAAAAINAVV